MGTLPIEPLLPGQRVARPVVTIPPPSLAERLAALERRFAGHQSNPLMLELQAVIARQFVEEDEHHAGDR